MQNFLAAWQHPLLLYTSLFITPCPARCHGVSWATDPSGTGQPASHMLRLEVWHAGGKLEALANGQARVRARSFMHMLSLRDLLQQRMLRMPRLSCSTARCHQQRCKARANVVALTLFLLPSQVSYTGRAPLEMPFADVRPAYPFVPLAAQTALRPGMLLSLRRTSAAFGGVTWDDCVVMARCVMASAPCCQVLYVVFGQDVVRRHWPHRLSRTSHCLRSMPRFGCSSLCSSHAITS
jgi:hypothetical protein